MRKFKAVILAMAIMAICASCAAASPLVACIPSRLFGNADRGVNEELPLIDEPMGDLLAIMN